MQDNSLPERGIILVMWRKEWNADGNLDLGQQSPNLSVLPPNGWIRRYFRDPLHLECPVPFFVDSYNGFHAKVNSFVCIFLFSYSHLYMD